MSSFPHVKPLKGADIVLGQLKHKIASGEYPPGSRLPSVVELAAGFEVGRSTVREALSALKAMGWVDIRHGGGTFVSRTRPGEEEADAGHFFHKTDSFQEVLEIRKFIEAGCASLAAMRRTEQDLQQLRAALAQMRKALGDEAESEKADVRFHLLVAGAAHNSLLSDMMGSLTHRLQESMGDSRRLWLFSERASAERLLQEHTDIYQAIAVADAALASERMLGHIGKVEAVLQRKLERK